MGMPSVEGRLGSIASADCSFPCTAHIHFCQPACDVVDFGKQGRETELLPVTQTCHRQDLWESAEPLKL